MSLASASSSGVLRAREADLDLKARWCRCAKISLLALMTGLSSEDAMLAGGARSGSSGSGVAARAGVVGGDESGPSSSSTSMELWTSVLDSAATRLPPPPWSSNDFLLRVCLCCEGSADAARERTAEERLTARRAGVASPRRVKSPSPSLSSPDTPGCRLTERCLVPRILGSRFLRLKLPKLNVEVMPGVFGPLLLGLMGASSLPTMLETRGRRRKAATFRLDVSFEC